MKSYILFFAFILSTSVIFSQEIIKEKISTEKTTYYENGQICEHGFFNKNGQLTGNWIKYDKDGTVIVQGVFENGKKQGKWIFWEKNTLREVDFNNNQVVKYTQWSKTEYLATR